MEQRQFGGLYVMNSFKRPFQEQREQQWQQKKRDMEDYLDSLQDKEYEVVESRLLTKTEAPSYRLVKVGFETFIHLCNA